MRLSTSLVQNARNGQGRRVLLPLPVLLFLLVGAPAGIGQEIHLTVYGDRSWHTVGTEVAGLTDLDGDGFDDFVVGASDADTVSGTSSGGARVHSGATGTVLFELLGPAPNSSFGFSAASSGDVDGDGWTDLVVGAPGDDTVAMSAGTAWVYSGVDGSALHVFQGASAFSLLGWSVDGAADVNRDGHADIVVGAPRADHLGYEHGSAYVYSGKDGSLIWRFDGTQDASFGSAVAAVGDVDGDTVPDIAVGADFDSSYTWVAGAVYVFSGRTGQVLLGAGGGQINDAFGFAVDAAGDVNQDGVPDLIVGAPQFGGLYPGYAQVLSGADGSVLYTWTGDGPFDEFGFSVAGLGDVDGDGYPDLAVGADQVWAWLGYVRVFSGRTGDLLYAVEGQGWAGLGYSVAAGGDVNGDGFPDLLAGAPGDDTVSLDAGSATVYALETLRLQPPSPGTAGTTNVVLAEGATPGQPVYFTYGFQEGVEPVPGCPRLSVDIQSPVLGGSAVADPAGTATLTTWVPAAASGSTVLLQAVELAPCTVSRLVRHSFP